MCVMWRFEAANAFLYITRGDVGINKRRFYGILNEILGLLIATHFRRRRAGQSN